MNKLLQTALLVTLSALPVAAGPVHLFQGEGYTVRVAVQGDRSQYVSGVEFSGPKDAKPFFVDAAECTTVTFDPATRDLFILFVNPGAPRYPPTFTLVAHGDKATLTVHDRLFHLRATWSGP